MKKENYFVIALTYIGTIIGAGFASGQEIKKFFADFGGMGIISFIFASFLFFYLGRKIMLMGYKSNAESYERVLTYAFTCKAKKFFDLIIIFFLIATVTTMFSGMGAILNQNFNIPFYIGSLIMLIISVLVVLGGIDKVMKLSLIAIPALIISTLLISFNSFTSINSFNFIEEQSNNSIFLSLFSAILYVSFNVIMAIAVLPVLGGVAKSEKEINKASLMSGTIIGIFGVIICFSLLVNYATIKSIEVPLALLANQSNGLYSVLYLISFIIAVATTAISALYGIYSRMGKNYFKLALITAIAYICSLFGFSILVKYLYTFMGYIGIVVILMLLRGFSKRRRE